MTTTEKLPLEEDPFFMPSIEQMNVVKELRNPKDRFHTYRTRSRANIRERIKIESTSYDDEMIGNDYFKAPPKFATDIDDCYQSELYNEPSRAHYRFKPITEMVKLREAFRKKLEIYWIKEKIVLDRVDAIKNNLIKAQVQENMVEYNKFLEDYKSNVFKESSKLKDDEREHFLETNRLRKIRDDLSDGIEPVKMNIFYHAINFVELTKYHKFQYLLKPTDWRVAHDHIHRTPDGDLENIRDSLNTLATSHLWDQNNTTLDVIMSFIENVYLEKPQQTSLVFETGGDFLQAYRVIQSLSIRPLQQYHDLSIIYANLENELQVFILKNEIYVDNLQRMHSSLSRRKNFMEQRLKELESTSKSLMNKPLLESTSNETLRTLRGLCEAAFQRAVTKTADASMTKHFSAVEKLTELEKKIFRLLETLDGIPKDLIALAEEKVRFERKRKFLQADRAYKIEMNVKFRIAQLRRCLTKPPMKVKREGKLPISVLPKKPPKEKKMKPLLTSIEQEYIRAFTELGVEGEIRFDENVKKMIDRIKNESTPFYLDHLLDKLGFIVPKETEQRFEEILRDETEKLKFKDVLPGVRSQVKLWQAGDEKFKKENIQKTQYLYE